MPGDLKLVVGLGNPGKRYIGTRHNIGFSVLERLASKQGFSFRQQSRLHGLIGEMGVGDQRIRFLQPQTFMNESGRSIRSAIDWFGLSPTELLVLVDDMDLPLGRLRLRSQGSAGGHNGLKSTIQYLGTQDFPRLRIGIGAPGQTSEERRQKTVSHVLGSFSQDEGKLIDVVMDEVLTGLELIQKLGLERAGSRINGFKAEGCLTS